MKIYCAALFNIEINAHDHNAPFDFYMTETILLSYYVIGLSSFFGLVAHQ
jgi:hypothetical protein